MLLPACVSRKNVAYLHDLESGEQINYQQREATLIRPGDLISIQVYSSDPDASQPFNLQELYSGGQLPGYNNGVASRQGYLVNNEGEITMPVVGTLKLGNLPVERAIELVKTNLHNYLKDPVVHIRILNFKVTVLGDVRSPGTFNIPNERVNLPEALGIAGDLNITAKRKNVLVLREENGTTRAYRVDITNRDLLNSPVYQLRQNDVVYVEPNRAQRNSASINSRAGIIISAASLIISIAILLK